MIFRVQCVLVLAALLVGGTPDWAAANHKMKQWLKQHNKGKPKAQRITVSRGYGYLKSYWRNFIKYGSVEDAPRAPKSCKIPEPAAARAAVLVKSGEEVTTRVRGKDFTYHSYYTSIEQACERCPELEQIRADHNATHAQLLVAMHKADPTLVYRKIFFKHTLTPAELLERSGFGAEALQKLRADPDFLKKIIFIDEASIVISDKTERWGSRSCARGYTRCCLQQRRALNKQRHQQVHHTPTHPRSILPQQNTEKHGSKRPSKLQQLSLRTNFKLGLTLLSRCGEVTPRQKQLQATRLAP